VIAGAAPPRSPERQPLIIAGKLGASGKLPAVAAWLRT